MVYGSKNRCARLRFSLLEVMIAGGILAVFLYICAVTLVATLEMQEEVGSAYDAQRDRSVGWSILHQDIVNTVGIYYHHRSFWAPPEQGGSQKADAHGVKNKKKKNELQKKAASDELLVFDGMADTEDPFLELVVSRGRLRDIEAEEEQRLPSFRKVKYYLADAVGEEFDGQMLLRTEERWQEPSAKGEVSDDLEENEFDLENLRRYGLIFDIDEVELSVYNGTAWEEEWSSLKNGDLPVALRLKYVDLRRGSGSEPMEKVLSFPLSYQIVGEPEEDF